jgi:hypothetical protein
MGWQVMRVPVDFSWPIDKSWFGDELPPIRCELCNGSGMKRSDDPAIRAAECELCEGQGEIFLNIPLPKGDGWQMWETTSATGSASSPVFATPEELARWLSDSSGSEVEGKTLSIVDLLTGESSRFIQWCTSETASYEQWLAVINDDGYACSFVDTKDGFVPGVQHKGDELIARKCDSTPSVEISA